MVFFVFVSGLCIDILVFVVRVEMRLVILELCRFGIFFLKVRFKIKIDWGVCLLRVLVVIYFVIVLLVLWFVRMIWGILLSFVVRWFR